MSVSCPGHVFPPATWGGALHILLRCRTPSILHLVTLQSLHSPQTLQWPSTRNELIKHRHETETVQSIPQGQRVSLLHTSYSVRGLSQSNPSKTGTGRLQVRVRLLNPPLHVLEQSVHCPQLESPPSTEDLSVISKQSKSTKK